MFKAFKTLLGSPEKPSTKSKKLPKEVPKAPKAVRVSVSFNSRHRRLLFSYNFGSHTCPCRRTDVCPLLTRSQAAVYKTSLKSEHFLPRLVHHIGVVSQPTQLCYEPLQKLLAVASYEGYTSSSLACPLFVALRVVKLLVTVG